MRTNDASSGLDDHDPTYPLRPADDSRDVFRCQLCKTRERPLFDRLGIEPGRISGALARLIALLGVVAPDALAAQMVGLLLGIQLDAMAVWREVQRLGAAYEAYDQALSLDHGDVARPVRTRPRAGCHPARTRWRGSRNQRPKRKKRSSAAAEAVPKAAPKAVPEAVSEAASKAASKAAPQPSEFREVKTGALMLPAERVETSPGRRSVLRRVLVTCWATRTRCSRGYGRRVRTGVEQPQDDRRDRGGRRRVDLEPREPVPQSLRDPRLPARRRTRVGVRSAPLRHGLQGRRRLGPQVGRSPPRRGSAAVIADLRALPGDCPEARELLDKLIVYYTANASRMRYDEYLRLGYGIGSGAVESAHKQILQARLRQAGMRWSVHGATHLLALRVLLLNGRWSELDRLRRPSLAA